MLTVKIHNFRTSHYQLLDMVQSVSLMSPCLYDVSTCPSICISFLIRTIVILN